MSKLFNLMFISKFSFSTLALVAACIANAQESFNTAFNDAVREESNNQVERRKSTLVANPNHHKTNSATNSSVERTAECLQIQMLSIEGLTLLSDKKRLAIESQIPTDCITTAKLDRLIQGISTTFLEAGFFNTSLKQRKVDNQLTWEIIVAEVDEIRNETTMRTMNLFPHSINNPLNIKDLDQGLDQANRLSGRKVTVDVYPKKDNKVAIRLVEDKQKTLYGSVGLNNFGSKRTGENHISANVHTDNPLGLADKASLYLDSSLPNHQKYSRGATLFYSVPRGYWTLSGFAGIYSYKTQTKLVKNTVEQTGKTIRYGGRADYTFSRGQRHISSAFLELAHTDIENRLLGSQVDNQSPSIDTVTVGMNHTQLLDNVAFNINGRYKQGLAKTRGYKDSFRKANLTLSVNQQASLFNHDMHFQHLLDAQVGSQRTPASEELTITGNYAINGFKDSNISGDSGFYVREKISTVLPHQSYVIKPYLTLGAGRVWSQGKNHESAIGGSAGIVFLAKYGQLNLSANKAYYFTSGNKSRVLPTYFQFQFQYEF